MLVVHDRVVWTLWPSLVPYLSFSMFPHVLCFLDIFTYLQSVLLFSPAQERIGFFNRSCSAGTAPDGQWTGRRAGPLLRDGTTLNWHQWTITKVGEVNGQDLVTIASWYPIAEGNEPR